MAGEAGEERVSPLWLYNFLQLKTHEVPPVRFSDERRGLHGRADRIIFRLVCHDIKDNHTRI